MSYHVISHHGQVWLNIQEKVTQELTHLLADRWAGGRCPGVRLDQGCVCRLELSLRYDTQHGRLTLGILSLRISAVND